VLKNVAQDLPAHMETQHYLVFTLFCFFIFYSLRQKDKEIAQEPFLRKSTMVHQPDIKPSSQGTVLAKRSSHLHF